MAKPIVSVLVDRDFIGISLFSLGLSVAVVVGAGTGFAMFLIGRYHERRRQHIAPAAALADAYRGVAPAIAGATFIVVTSLGAVGWLSLARIGMFATTGILCSIGVLAVGLAALTLTPARRAGQPCQPPQTATTQAHTAPISATRHTCGALAGADIGSQRCVRTHHDDRAP